MSSLDLERLLHELEFENQQSLKDIQVEIQIIQATEKQIEDDKNGEAHALTVAHELDEDNNTRYQQIDFNEKNIESLKKTNEIVTNHGHSLEQNEIPQQKRRQAIESQDRADIIAKYQKTKDEYEAIYENLDNAKLLKVKEEELQSLEATQNDLEERIQQQEYQNKYGSQHKDDKFVPFTSPNELIIRIAEIGTAYSKFSEEENETLVECREIDSSIESKQRENEDLENQKKAREEKQKLEDQKRLALAQQKKSQQLDVGHKRNEFQEKEKINGNRGQSPVQGNINLMPPKTMPSHMTANTIQTGKPRLQAGSMQSFLLRKYSPPKLQASNLRPRVVPTLTVPARPMLMVQNRVKTPRHQILKPSVSLSVPQLNLPLQQIQSSLPNIISAQRTTLQTTGSTKDSPTIIGSDNSLGRKLVDIPRPQLQPPSRLTLAAPSGIPCAVPQASAHIPKKFFIPQIQPPPAVSNAMKYTEPVLTCVPQTSKTPDASSLVPVGLVEDTPNIQTVVSVKSGVRSLEQANPCIPEKSLLSPDPETPVTSGGSCPTTDTNPTELETQLAQMNVQQSLLTQAQGISFAASEDSSDSYNFLGGGDGGQARFSPRMLFGNSPATISTPDMSPGNPFSFGQGNTTDSPVGFNFPGFQSQDLDASPAGFNFGCMSDDKEDGGSGPFNLWGGGDAQIEDNTPQFSIFGGNND